MKRTLTYITIVALAISLSGCDYVRKIAGRPTSEDIEQMKEELEIAELRRQLAEYKAAAGDSSALAQLIARDEEAAAPVEETPAQPQQAAPETAAQESVPVQPQQTAPVTTAPAANPAPAASTAAQPQKAAPEIKPATEDEALEYFHKAKKLVNVKNLKAMNCAPLEAGYYVVVGSFANDLNAIKMNSAARKAGFETTVITYTNGMTAIALAPAKDALGAYQLLQNARKCSFCPKDAWVIEVK